jgi:predicted TIM-barrel fold metal-dependent hydrolase
MLLTRRETLQLGIAAAAGTLLAADDDSFPIVDCHTHFYDPEKPGGVPWPPKEAEGLYRTMLPADYRKQGDPLGVTGTVIVEASPWVEDNQWVLDISQNDPFVLGLVGNLAPGSPDFSTNFARFAKNRLFLGIRVNSGELAKGLSTPAYLADLKRLAIAGMELDVNGGPEVLPIVDQLAKKLPDLRIAINHLANLRIDGKTPPKEWLTGMAAAAKHPQVFCKVSALVEGATPQPPATDVEYYRPVLDHAWKTFGDDRLIYGSDWPVSERCAPLDVVQRIMMDYLSNRPREIRAKFFADNAMAAYQWLPR